MANIYVIDDDDQLLRMVGLMLERGGHAPTLINDPFRGLEQIKSSKPDMVVLDVMMPGMSGHDVCRQIRADEALADLPVLILTARAQDVDRVAALQSGADDYLSKPVTSQELIERVDDLMGSRKQAAKRREALILSFLSLRGGVGRTTLAVNMAAALRRISQEEVCLVDLSPSGGQAVMHLRMQPKTSWANLPAPDALDWDTLKENLLIHQSGLRVLAAPAMPQRPSTPSAELTTRLIQLLKENMAAVVFDLPPLFSASVRAALGGSDIVLNVVTPEMVAVQTAAQTNRTLASVKLKQRSYILNQVGPEAQLPQQAVERGVGGRLAFKIGYDPNQSRALAQGVPLTLTPAQTPLPVVVRRMAEVIWQRVSQAG